MTQIINGTVCRNCSDVDRARRAQLLGVDPSRILPGGEVKPNAAQPGDTGAAAATGVNDPLPTGSKGRAVNILA